MSDGADAREKLADARSDVCLCDGCYANRRGTYLVGCHGFCLVCMLTMKSPNWMAAIIRKLDRAGSWRGDL